jgi:hypothetical protein
MSNLLHLIGSLLFIGSQVALLVLGLVSNEWAKHPNGTPRDKELGGSVLAFFVVYIVLLLICAIAWSL